VVGLQGVSYGPMGAGVCGSELWLMGCLV